MPRDVRMRGFKERADVDDVVRWLDARELKPTVRRLPLAEAEGRVLSEDLVSQVNVPPFRRAAMDGWAVHGEDTFGAAASDPLTLAIVGESMPGKPYKGPVAKGQAVRIMTGAEVPDDADAVLRAEEGSEDGDVLSVRAAVPPQKHVARVGEDIDEGERVLATGRRLRPQDLGVAASIGHGELPVIVRPRVAILATGDELLPPGARPGGSKIVDSNTPMLTALVLRDHGIPLTGPIIRDGEANIREALEDVQGDVVLVSGGSSVGKEDHAPRLVEELGELVFHGLAMRPAAPTGIGVIGRRVVFLLPGNPVSCLSAYDWFAARVIRRMGGLDPAWPYAKTRGTLARKVSSVLGRVDYVRVTLEDGVVTPLMTRGASILSSTVKADGFLT
ncbi:MAG: molybdopterin molybdotransferase MoeA, partial [Planctomycetota bacterium]|nr:molybdopterin molybdotransferase MoeA [Planctomycetota bacterium]